MGGEQQGGGKKRGRPRKTFNEGSETSKAASNSPSAVRRSRRQRRPRRARDFADYGDDDDDFFWWESSSDDEAGAKKKADDGAVASDDGVPRKFRLLKKLPSHAKRKVECGGDYPSDGSCGSGEEEGDEVGGSHSAQERESLASGPGFTPLPDKKILQAVLDKLQKKDIYGVYAEPVDPEELPDYHEIISNPMDFETIRTKLADGAYCNLENFESDVFLLCSNAMQYNSPDTIYFKQAHSIQELAKKKFQRLRLAREELSKSEAKNQKLTVAAPPSNGDVSSGTSVLPANAFQQPANSSGNLDVSLTNDEKSAKGEDNSVKNPYKAEGKPEALYEDRRSTYNHPIDHLPLSLWDDEQRHLLPLGLGGDQYPYARSLARFAGPLGPAAWRIASQKIKQALPPGVSFGRGWVGEYEAPHQGPYLLNLAENKGDNVSPWKSTKGLGFNLGSSIEQPKSTIRYSGVNHVAYSGGNPSHVALTNRSSGQSQPEGILRAGSQLSSAGFGQHFSGGATGQTSADVRLGEPIGRSVNQSSSFEGKTLVGQSQDGFGQTLADARFGQHFALNGDESTHFDARAVSDRRYDQNLDGFSRIGQTFTISGNQISQFEQKAAVDGRSSQSLGGFGQNPAAVRLGQPLALRCNQNLRIDDRAALDGFGQTPADVRFNPSFALGGSQSSPFESRAVTGGRTGQSLDVFGQSPADIRFGQPFSIRGGQLSHFEQKAVADGRSGQSLDGFGQTPADIRFSQSVASRASQGSHLDCRALYDGRSAQVIDGFNQSSHFGQNLGRNVNPVSYFGSGILGDGRIGQTFSPRLRSSPIDAITTAAPTRISIGRYAPGQLPLSSSLLRPGLETSSSSHDQDSGARESQAQFQNSNHLPGFPQVNLAAVPRQACWRGLSPHGNEACPLNVGFGAPRLAPQQPVADPPQPDLALQL
ncbi:uncharacterized protein LOC144704354 [Wolffia australiana]